MIPHDSFFLRIGLIQSPNNPNVSPYFPLNRQVLTEYDKAHVFPGGSYDRFSEPLVLIHIKAGEAQVGERLAQHLAGQPEAVLSNWRFTAGIAPAAREADEIFSPRYIYLWHYGGFMHR